MIRKIKNIVHGMVGWFWVFKCGYPAKSLKVIGVTGTDGKTTTTTLIYEMLKAAGIKVGVVTTVAAKIGNEEIDTGLHVTNPGPELLQPMLLKMKQAGMTHVVLEVTSHGLDQNRVVGCNFWIGVMTNISHEHLDYHQTMQNYVEAKAKLFSRTKYAILNKDDKFFNFFKNKAAGQIVDYGRTNISEVSLALLGDYNKYNIAAAEVAAKICGVEDKIIFQVVKGFVGIKGRREEIKMGQKFRVIVDFAHTPNAIENIAEQLKKELPKGKTLTIVFGCPGKRDESKRTLMGQAAVKYADKVIITADDPRNDDMGRIFSMATADLSQLQMQKVVRIDDRKKALEEALAAAKMGDMVLLAGKGHEKSLAVGNEEISWSDQEEAKRILREILR